MPTPLFDVAPAVLDQAAASVQQLLMDKLADERGVRIEDAISGAAALTGTLLLRSTGVPLDELQPGSTVLGDAVDELGQPYVQFIAVVCDMMGIDPRSGWADPIPPDHQPHRTVLQLTQLLEPAYLQLCDQLAIAAAVRPRLALFTAARIISVGRKVLDPEVGKAIALSSLVASAKMAPHPLTRQI